MIKLKHKKLNVWKLAIELTVNIYRITGKFPKSEVYGLASQLQRAAVSVPSNIAEGAARSSAKERKRFYEIARSSLVEIDTQLEIAIRLNYLKGENEDLEDQLNHIFAMLSNLIKRPG
ncbi:MAG TPA: four helix bundle protein [Balneolaceae bacterium]